MNPVGYTYLDITASGAVKIGKGLLHGMFVNSTTAGTIKIWDSLSASGSVLNNTITPPVGYYPLGDARFGTGVFATITGTLDVTFYFD